MTANEFILNCEQYFGKWSTDFKKAEIFNFIRKHYTTKDIDVLWREVKAVCSKPPDERDIRHVLSPVSNPDLKVTPRALTFMPGVFSTKTGERFGQELAPFMKMTIAQDSKRDDMLDEMDRKQMQSRAGAYWDCLAKLFAGRSSLGEAARDLAKAGNE